MQRSITTLVLIFFLSIQSFAQLQWTVDPESLDIECDPSMNHSTIETYLQGLAATSASCANPAIITWDYTDPGSFACSDEIYIEITAEDECGVDPDLVANIYVFIEDDTDPEPIGTTPVDLLLQCGDPNNATLIQDWINDFYNTVFEDDCTDQMDLLYYEDYTGNIPDCGYNDYVSFSVEDDCGNQWFDFAEISVEDLGEVSFSPYSVTITESNPTESVCLSISKANIMNTVATVELLPSSTAENGVDYNTIPVSQTVTFPANSTADVCFDLTLIDDTEVELTEYIEFDITSATSNGMNVLSGQDSRYYSIIDNDDNDNDGIGNLIDNCPNTANNNQSDIDSDGIGDVCDGSIVVNTLIETKENIYVDKNNGGIILTSNSGLCFLLIADDNGVLSAVPVECP